MIWNTTKRVVKAGGIVLLGPVVGVLLGFVVSLVVRPDDWRFALYFVDAGVVLGTITSCVLASGLWHRGATFPISRIGQVVLIMAVVGAAAGSGWTAWNWKLLRPYHWQQVDSPDGAFSLSFPGKPKASTQYETDAIDGRHFLSTRLTASPAPRIGYAVSWWENPEQKDKPTAELFAHFRDCAAQGVRGKVRTKELTVAGHPAIDIVTFDVPEVTVIHNRVIRVGSRIYSLWVIDGSEHYSPA